MSRPTEIARRAGGNAVRALRRLLLRHALSPGPGNWLQLRLAPPLEDGPSPLLPRHGGPTLSLLEALQCLEAAARDPALDGVLLRFEGAPSGFSKALSLRRAVAALGEAGVPVAAYAENLDAGAAIVASAADEIWMPPQASLELLGVRFEGTYYRGLLDHLSIQPELIRVGSHKSAGERFTRRDMSSEEREQLELLADDCYQALVDALAAGRGLEAGSVRDRIDRGPYRGASAVEAGLIDRCLYPDQVERELLRLTPVPDPGRPGPRRVHLVDGLVYHALLEAHRPREPLRAGAPELAYVAAAGPITRVRGGRGSIACDDFRELLQALGREEQVRAVVLRIDSPGGDALASDLLWHSITRLREDKPVVVSMGEVVGSGGYYLAAAADRVLAEAATVTGSIGVVGGKVNLAGLYDRLGVGKDAVERGRRAGLLSPARGFSQEERSALRGDMEAVYRAFVGRVAEGRRMAAEAVEPVAQGRVWSGARAHSGGLVDALGGPLEAIAEARERAGFGPDEPLLVSRRPRGGPLRALTELTGWLGELRQLS